MAGVIELFLHFSGKAINVYLHSTTVILCQRLEIWHVNLVKWFNYNKESFISLHCIDWFGSILHEDFSFDISNKKSVE